MNQQIIQHNVLYMVRIYASNAASTVNTQKIYKDFNKKFCVLSVHARISGKESHKLKKNFLYYSLTF